MDEFEGISIGDLRNSVANAWRPRTPVNPVEWLPSTVRFPSHWETSQFDFDSQPYCRGVIERCWMNERIRKINLKWASRLGKTTLVVSLMTLQLRNDPCPMVILYPDNGERDRSIDNQVYPLLEATPYTARQILPPAKRNRVSIRFNECRVRIASGGEKSSVSGFPARVIFKVEHDKNPTRKSSEADASLRVESRAAGYARGVKILEEGTPSDKESSRAYALEISPDVQRLKYYCPCPHCGKFQTLEFEQIQWTKDANGRSTKALAASTAYYECLHCEGKINDHHRTNMIRAGVWLAEGEKVDKVGRIKGKPVVDSDTQLLELSALNSLLIKGWGVIAAEFVEADNAAKQGKLDKLRKFWNEVLARVWDPAQRKTQPHKVAERLACNDHQQVQTLPQWTSFLTFTSDVGKIGEDLIFYWLVTAWGSPNKIPRGAMVDWGITETKAEFLKEWRQLVYPVHGMKDSPLMPVWGQPAAIDSGDFTKEIYDMCAPIRNCFPLKADSRVNATDLYRLGYARAGLTPRQIALKKKMGKPDLFEPGSDVTQGWRQALVEGRTSIAEPGFVSLPADVCERWEEFRDFLDELTADQLLEGKWIGDDNEFGDTLRYARALAECYVDGRYRGHWERLPLIQVAGRQGTSGLFARRSAPTSERFVR